MSASGLRPDLAAIADMIRPGSRVLDVGCGDGALLEHLVRTKNVDGRGIEISQANVNACVARGLAVVQGDADSDLVDYPAQVFDAVILSQTIQAWVDGASSAKHTNLWRTFLLGEGNTSASSIVGPA
jgi:methionine biosynthesis protein MetW